MLASETVILRIALGPNQSFERARDLPFLIAFRSGRQRSGFPDKLYPGLDQTIDIEKLWMPSHGGSRCRREHYSLSSHQSTPMAARRSNQYGASQNGFTGQYCSFTRIMSETRYCANVGTLKPPFPSGYLRASASDSRNQVVVAASLAYLLRILSRRNRTAFTKSRRNENKIAAARRLVTVTIASGFISTPLTANRLMQIRSTTDEMSHLPSREVQRCARSRATSFRSRMKRFGSNFVDITLSARPPLCVVLFR